MMSEIEWPPETAQIVENLKDKVRELIKNNEKAKSDFADFMKVLHATPDGSIKVTEEEAIEFLVHVFVIKPTLNAVLGIEKSDEQ